MSALMDMLLKVFTEVTNSMYVANNHVIKKQLNNQVYVTKISCQSKCPFLSALMTM